MPQWIIVAALLSVLATVWLAWLLWRVNVGPQAKRNTDGGRDGGTHVYVGDGGKSRHDNDANDGGSDGGSDGGGDGGGGGD
jgi:hypothetical protein